MSESGMRGNFVKFLKGLGLDAVAVENPIFPGTPDVNYLHGWVELKWIRSWPKNPETPVRLKRYTNSQKLWIRRRTLAGGKAFLLVQCKREWFLFKHPETMEIDGTPRQNFYDKAYRIWRNGLNTEEVMEALCN